LRDATRQCSFDPARGALPRNEAPIPYHQEMVLAPDLTSIRRELDTDWVPDPWAWAKPELLATELVLSRLNTLRVPLLGGRARTVPLLAGEWRFHLQAAVRRVMRQCDPELSDGVVAYRMLPDGTIEHYRDALHTRQARNTFLSARHPIIAVTDIARFFPSISTKSIESVIPRGDDLSKLLIVLECLEEQYGYVLPEGYAAARCLANCCLAPLDSTIKVPFTRWVDDYAIFCSDDLEAGEVLGTLGKVASEQGLRLSELKTEIRLSTEHNLAVTSSVIDHGSTEYRQLLNTLPDLLTNNDRAARLLLHLAAEKNDADPLRVLLDSEPSALPPTLMPRLAWFLASIPWSEESTHLVESLLSVEDEWFAWRRARLAGALWYGPESAVDACHEALVRAIEDGAPGAAMSARVLAQKRPDEITKRIDFFDDERERLLLTAEAASPTTYESLPPPIASFL
jgi:hypothetical protein